MITTNSCDIPYYEKNPTFSKQYAKRLDKPRPLIKIQRDTLKNNICIESSHSITISNKEGYDVPGCKTLRQFLQSVHYKLQKGFIPYDELMKKFSTRKNLPLPMELQSLLLKIYRHHIHMHIERIEISIQSVKIEKLRLKDGAQTKQNKGPMTYESKNYCLNNVMNVLRNCSPLKLSKGHKKCEVSSYCSFCLLRSSIIKINNLKGRQSLIPTEVELQISNKYGFDCEPKIMTTILQQACKSNHSLGRAMKTKLICSSCKDIVACSDDNLMLNIDSDSTDRSFSFSFFLQPYLVS